MVRLYGTKQSGKTDSLSRYLTVLNQPFESLRNPSPDIKNTSPLVDTFKGYNKGNPDHKFKVYFAKKQPESLEEPKMMFYNLPEGCVDKKKWGLGNSSLSIGYNAMAFSGDFAGCHHAYGWVYLQENHKHIRAEYSMYKYPDTGGSVKVNKIFIGTKVE